jgi:hypothetical protein
MPRFFRHPEKIDTRLAMAEILGLTVSDFPFLR